MFNVGMLLKGMGFEPEKIKAQVEDFIAGSKRTLESCDARLSNLEVSSVSIVDALTLLSLSQAQQIADLRLIIEELKNGTNRNQPARSAGTAGTARR